MNRIYKTFASNVATIGVAQILKHINTIILLIILSRFQDTAGFGLWSQVKITINLFAPIVTLSLPFAMVRMFSCESDSGKISRAFYSILTLIVLNSLIVLSIVIVFCIALPAITELIDSEILIISSLLVAITALNNCYLSYFRSQKDMKTFSFFDVGELAITTLLFLIFSSLGYGVVSLLWIWMGVKVIVLMGLAIVVSNKIKYRGYDIGLLKEYLWFSLPLFLSTFAAWVVNSSDRYIVGYFYDLDKVGIYSASYDLGSLIILFSTVLSFVLVPNLSPLYEKNDRYKIDSILKITFKSLCLLGFPFVVGSALLGNDILAILMGINVEEGGYNIVYIIAAGVLCLDAFIIMVQILQMQKNTKKVSSIWFRGAILNLILNFYLTPRYSLYGAAIATFISFFYMMINVFIITRKEVKILPKVMDIIKIVIACTLMGGAVYCFKMFGLIGPIANTLVGVTVYGLILGCIGILNGDEKKFIRDWVLKKNSVKQ